MNRIINHIFVLAAVALALSACKEVDPLDGAELGQFGITSVSASFIGDAYNDDPNATFTAYPDDDGNILIKVPYFYPETSDFEVSEDMLKQMRVTAGMQAGTEISPKLGVIDMTKTYDIVASDAAGRTKDYVLSAEITKLSDCYMESFDVTSEGVTYNGIIVNENATISLLATGDELTNCTISYTVSSHATLSGYTEGMTLRTGDQITVTAHNGVDKTVYTISLSIPGKMEVGARAGSGRSVWTKFYASDYKFSLEPEDVPLRFAAHGDNLYLLTGKGIIHNIDRHTGEYLGTVPVPGGLKVNSMVSDEAGNILLAADAAKGETFTVYAVDSMDGTPVELLSAENDIDAEAMGNIRVTGDINSNAVVTATAWYILRAGKAWQITDGEYDTFRNISFNGGDLWVKYNACFLGASDRLSDGVFAFGYWYVYDLYFSYNYSDFSVAYSTGHTDSDNTNCLSTVTFNGLRYLAYGVGTHFSYGVCPTASVVESTYPTSMENGLLGTISDSSMRVGGWIGESGASSDVLLVVSDDGYYMDLYFTDANYGIITCYEFDCLEL